MNRKPELDSQEGNKDDQTATAEEAIEAIRQLQPADLAKLMIIAKYFKRSRLRSSMIEAEDLLHDAIVKTVDRTRKWNMRVSIVKHLDRAMESDSGHVLEKTLEMAIDTMDVMEPASDGPGIDSRLEAAERLKEIIPLFKDDARSLELLRLNGDGFRAAEIQAQLGMDAKEYDTVCRRIRRIRVRLLKGDR